MNRRRNIFLTIELILWGLIVINDLLAQSLIPYSEWVKFSSILLCAIYSYCSLFDQVKRTFLSAIVLSLIVASDYQLLMKDNYLLGVIFFAFVQLGIFVWIARKQMIRGKYMVISLSVDLCMTIFLCFCLQRGDIPIDSLIFTAIFYFMCFTNNLIWSFVGVRRNSSRENKFFFAGMSLYYFCDICVAIFNLSSYININSTIYNYFSQVASVLIWAVYLPGIVMLTLVTNHGINELG